MTTMELSTTMPMATTRAMAVTTFKEKSNRSIRARVSSRDRGMELPTMRLALTSPKKTNNTSMARTTPSSRVLPTCFRAWSTISEPSYMVTYSMASFLAASSSRELKISRAVLTVLADWRLVMSTSTQSLPL